MNILLVSYNYTPMNNGGVQRPLKMVKYLKRQGHNVYILTHNYRESFSYINNEIRIYDINKNSYHKLIYYPVRSIQKIYEKFLSKGKPKSIWVNNVKKKSKKIIDICAPDVIIATYPSIQVAEIGLFFSTEYNIPLITDFRDGLLFESIESVAIKENKKLKGYYEDIEGKIVNLSKHIITVSPPLSSYFEQKYKLKNVSTIPNGFDHEDYNEISLNSETILKFDTAHFNIVYTGRFSFSDSGTNVREFFCAFSKLLNHTNVIKKKVVLHLFGEFSAIELEIFKPFIKSQNLFIYGLLPRSIVLNYQREADLLLLITNQERKSVATGKVFEYLVAQKPIFALAKGVYAGEIITDTESGWVVDGSNIEEIYLALISIVGNRDYYNEIKPNMDKINIFSRENQIIELNNIINEVVKNNAIINYTERK